MKAVRVLLAALVGGIIVFGWGAVTHTVLPKIGMMGVKPLPGETVVVPALQLGIAEPGYYLFPWAGTEADEAAQKAAQEKYKTGPHGVVVFNPKGEELNMAKFMGTEFASNVLAALLLGIVLCGLGGGVGRGLGVGLAMGLFAWLSVEVSYWNWDGFPCDKLAGALIDQGVSWTLAGAVMGLIVGKCKAAAAA